LATVLDKSGGSTYNAANKFSPIIHKDIMATTDDKKIIYSMMRVGKVHPPNKHVLKDISLSYFYGAKLAFWG
jgi:hypothetical protein